MRKYYLNLIQQLQFFKGNVSKCNNVIFMMMTFLASFASAANDRVDLIKLAHEGLNYFLISATHNPSFSKTLNPSEIQFLTQLSLLLEQRDAIKFAQGQNIQAFSQSSGNKFYAYVDLNEKVKTLNIPSDKNPEILVSNQRDLFKNLKPGEPERFLKTTSEFAGAIWVNQSLLNDASVENFDIGLAVSILIHEYGHKARPMIEQKLGRKLTDAEIQPVIDQFGIKLGDFVRSKVMKFPLKNGSTIFALNSMGFPNEQWLDVGFMKGLSFISLIDQQGLYFWTDFQGEIRDISKQVRSQFKLTGLPKVDSHDKYYQFKNLALQLPSKIRVTEAEAGQVKFQITIGQVAVQLPFMIPNISPDPKTAQFNNRYRWSESGYVINPVTQSFAARINGTSLLVSSPEVTHRQISLMPDFSAKPGQVEWVGNDLYFNIEVPDKEGRLTMLALTQKLFLLSCEVKIKTQDGKDLYLSSLELDPSKVNTERIAQYRFRLQNAKHLGLSSIEIEKVYLRTRPELLSVNSEIRLEIPLFERFQIILPSLQSKPIKPLHLVPTEILSVQSKNEIVTLKVRSSQPIQRISLVLDVTNLSYALVTMQKDLEVAFYKWTDSIELQRTVQVELTSEQFHAFQGSDGLIDISINPSELTKIVESQMTERDLTSKGLVNKMYTVRTLAKNMKLKRVGVIGTSLAVAETQLRSDVIVTVQQKFKSRFEQTAFEFGDKNKQHRVIINGLCEFLFNE